MQEYGKDQPTIVVGTDGSASAMEAVRRAAQLAASGDATLHIVCGYRQPTHWEIAREQHKARARYAYAYAEHGGSDFDGIADARTQTIALLEDAARTVQAPGLRIFLHAVQGRPAEALADVAGLRRADLIVVGNRGVKGLRRHLHRPICEQLQELVPSRVMVVDTEAFWSPRGRAVVGRPAGALS